MKRYFNRKQNHIKKFDHFIAKDCARNSQRPSLFAFDSIEKLVSMLFNLAIKSFFVNCMFLKS